MITSELSAFSKLEFNLRPARLSYFVFEDDEIALARAMTLNCTQWGGIRNLIVPVTADVQIPQPFIDLLKLHEPDVSISFLTEEHPTARDNFNKLRQLLTEIRPYHKNNLQSGQSFEEHDDTVHTLHAIPKDVLQNNTLKIQTLARLLHLERIPDSLLALSLFGQIMPGQEADYATLTTVEVQEVPLSGFWQDQFDLSPFASAINLTSYGLRSRTATDYTPSNRFDIVLVNSLGDLCLYWCLRATREAMMFGYSLNRRTLLFPSSFLNHPALMQGLVEFVREHYSYPGVTTNLHMHFLVDKLETANSVERVLSKIDGVERFAGTKIKSTHTWGDMESQSEPIKGKRLHYHFNQWSLLFPGSFTERATSLTLSNIPLREGNNEILFSPPDDFHNPQVREVALDLVGELWERYPKSRLIAEAINRDGFFSRYGYSLLTSVSPTQTQVSINLPSEWKSLELFFEEKGYEVDSTNVSRYSDALVNLIGGIQKADILAQKPVYLLLDRLATKSTKKVVQRVLKQLPFEITETKADELQRLFDEIEVIPEIKGTVKTYRALRSDNDLRSHHSRLLEYLSLLCEAKVLNRGYYVECPRCGTSDWYPLHKLSEFIECVGCGYQFLLPVVVGNEENVWRYRLNTLVNRAMDQDILPAILAVYTLTHNKNCSCLTFGLTLKRDGQEITDFDFLFVRQQKVFAGECKAGTGLGEKDSRNALLAAELGFAGFYFCTVREFSEDALSQIEHTKLEVEAAGYEMSLGVLDGNDLLEEAI